MSEDTTPPGSLAHLGSALPIIVETVAVIWDNKDLILFSKLDRTDSFWRMVCEEGVEWHFAYELPTPEGSKQTFVIPKALQMGWVNSPGFFSLSLETVTYIMEKYMITPVGSLLEHPLEENM